MTLHAREPFSKTGSTLACAIIVAPLMALRTPLWELWNMLTVCLLLKRFELAKVLCLSQDVSKWGHDLRSHFIWILWICLMKFSKFDTYFLNHQTFICLSGDSIFAVASSPRANDSHWASQEIYSCQRNPPLLERPFWTEILQFGKFS